MPDASGTPTTNYSIPKYNTGTDPPSGKGFNTAIDFIDALLANNATLLGARARLAVRKNSGGSDFIRRRINFIEGANITLTVADDAGSEEVDVTIAGTAASNVMELISDSTLGADAANFDLTSIPGTYKHLKLICTLRGTFAAAGINGQMRFNNDSGANYDYQNYTAADANNSVNADQNFAQTAFVTHSVPGSTARANRFSILEILIPDYANTTREKVWIGSGFFVNDSALAVFAQAGGAWRSTAALNRITVYPGSGNFLAGSRVSLYGIN